MRIRKAWHWIYILHIYISPVREHETTRLEPLVPGVEDSVQHGLVEEAVAHPLRDDDVNLKQTKNRTESRTLTTAISMTLWKHDITTPFLVAVLLIRDVYPGSDFFSYRIPDPGFNDNINFTKPKIFNFLAGTGTTEKKSSQLTKNLSIFSKNSYKPFGFDPGSGKIHSRSQSQYPRSGSVTMLSLYQQGQDKVPPNP